MRDSVLKSKNDERKKRRVVERGRYVGGKKGKIERERKMSLFHCVEESISSALINEQQFLQKTLSRVYCKSTCLWLRSITFSLNFNDI